MGHSDGKPRAIFIPAPGSDFERELAPGSAVVGFAPTEEQRATGARITVDVEGNLYDAVNLRLYRERVHNAWDRQATRYPTSSRLAIPVGELIEVGRTTESGGIDWIDATAVSAWTGETELSLRAPEQKITPWPFSPGRPGPKF